MKCNDKFRELTRQTPPDQECFVTAGTQWEEYPKAPIFRLELHAASGGYLHVDMSPSEARRFAFQLLDQIHSAYEAQQKKFLEANS